MRRVGIYHFVLENCDPIQAFAETKQVIQSWSLDVMGSKPFCQPEEYDAKYQNDYYYQLRITEDTGPNQIFRTTIELSSEHESLHLDCFLETGTIETCLQPVHFTAHCPKLLRTIVSLSPGWKSLGHEVLGNPVRYRQGDGIRLFDFITNPERRIPFVVVSEWEGLMLHPDLDKSFAYDLLGMAVVGSLTEDASWELTRKAGSAWSCFNGALRVYWPLLSGNLSKENPFRHPLWTASNLLEGNGCDTQKASKRIRNQIVQSIFNLSTITVKSSGQGKRIRISSEREQRKKLVSVNTDSEGLSEALVKLEFENEQLERAIFDLEERNSELRQRNEHIENQLAYYKKRTENIDTFSSTYQSPISILPEELDITPETATPPVSLEEAVNLAKRNCQFLRFGDDVPEGISKLNPTAGPPEKVLKNLLALNELSEIMSKNDGQAGLSWDLWLKTKNTDASSEKLSKKEQLKRTWSTGNGRETYYWHIKTNNATSPDTCVRIYFLYDKSIKLIIVGWVGPHP